MESRRVETDTEKSGKVRKVQKRKPGKEVTTTIFQFPPGLGVSPNASYM